MGYRRRRKVYHFLLDLLSRCYGIIFEWNFLDRDIVLGLYVVVSVFCWLAASFVYLRGWGRVGEASLLFSLKAILYFGRSGRFAKKYFTDDFYYVFSPPVFLF